MHITVTISIGCAVSCGIVAWPAHISMGHTGLFLRRPKHGYAPVLYLSVALPQSSQSSPIDRAMAPPRPPTEMLLRIQPEEPVHLFRTSPVCKAWRRRPCLPPSLLPLPPRPSATRLLPRHHQLSARPRFRPHHCILSLLLRDLQEQPLGGH